MLLFKIGICGNVVYGTERVCVFCLFSLTFFLANKQEENLELMMKFGRWWWYRKAMIMMGVRRTKGFELIEIDLMLLQAIHIASAYSSTTTCGRRKHSNFFCSQLSCFYSYVPFLKEKI